METSSPWPKAIGAREKYLEQILELQKEERNTAASIAEYAVRLKNAGQAKEITEATVTSLFQAIGALKQIAVVLRVNAMFWKQMGEHCKELASSELGAKVKMYKTLPMDEKRVFYIDQDFKEEVVTHLAGWKAVELIAADYGKACGEVRAQIQEDFVKNPSTEQSRSLAPMLGAKLLKAAEGNLEENAAETKVIELALAATSEAA